MYSFYIATDTHEYSTYSYVLYVMRLQPVSPQPNNTLVPLVQIGLAEHRPVGTFEHLADGVHKGLGAVLVVDQCLRRDRKRRDEHDKQRPNNKYVLHL